MLRVGGLALVVRARPECRENIGRVVTIVKIEAECDDGYPYLASAKGLACVDSFGSCLSDYAWFTEKGLMPLRGDPDAAVIDQKELAIKRGALA